LIWIKQAISDELSRSWAIRWLIELGADREGEGAKVIDACPATAPLSSAIALRYGDPYPATVAAFWISATLQLRLFDLNQRSSRRASYAHLISDVVLPALEMWLRGIAINYRRRG
jgi:hypothetical protein